MSKLQRLSIAYRRAARVMQAEMERQYPKDTEIRFTIRANQINPSSGTVLGGSLGDPAYLRVRMNSKTQRIVGVHHSRIWGKS